MLTAMLMAQTDDWTPPTYPVCAVSHATVFYDRLKDMPQEIQDDARKRGPIADAGERYDRGGASFPNRPSRGFVRGGKSEGKWFVWIDQGGYSRYYSVFGYEDVFEGANIPSKPVRIANFQGDPCAAINAIFDGVSSGLPQD
jgi:hypothetical protein